MGVKPLLCVLSARIQADDLMEFARASDDGDAGSAADE